MFKGIQYFCQLDRGILAYSCYPAAGNERFYDDNVWIGLDMGRLVYGNERDALSDTGKGGMALPDRSRLG